MLPFRKILFPVDYSESAKRIVPFVYDAAQKHSADLLLVHAYGAEALAETNMRLADPALFDEVRGLQTERLRSYGEKYFGGTKFEPIARLGEADFNVVLYPEVARGAALDRAAARQQRDAEA